ncbi:RT_RNaseH domain-containing protein [Trichonephila clavipes]|nr:RT_RNaseH domain-containing protein [Trichonephila clavipes]
MWLYYCKLRGANDFESVNQLIVADKMFEMLDSETATHIGVLQGEEWYKPRDLGKQCDIFYASKGKSYDEPERAKWNDSEKRSFNGSGGKQLFGEKKPIAFASQKFNATQKNWASIEKEAWAVLYGLNKFDKWIYGAKVEIISDHNPLKYLNQTTPQSPKLTRWALALQRWNHSITHRPGGACKEPLPAPGNRSNERRYKEKDLARTEEKRSERRREREVAKKTGVVKSRDG